MIRIILFSLLSLTLLTQCTKEQESNGALDGRYCVVYKVFTAPILDGVIGDTSLQEWIFDLTVLNDRFIMPFDPTSDYLWDIGKACSGIVEVDENQVSLTSNDCDCWCDCSPYIDCAGHPLLGRYTLESQDQNWFLSFEENYEEGASPYFYPLAFWREEIQFIRK